MAPKRIIQLALPPERMNQLRDALSGEKLYDLVDADPRDFTSVWRRVEAVFEEHFGGLLITDRIAALDVLITHFETEYELTKTGNNEAAAGFQSAYQFLESMLRKTLAIEVKKIPIHIQDRKKDILYVESHASKSDPEAFDFLLDLIQTMESARKQYQFIFEKESFDQESKLQPTERIRWKGTQEQLAYLIYSLKEAGLIKSGRHWKQAVQSFVYEDGSPYKSVQLKSIAGSLGFAAGGSSSTRAREIDEIVSETKERGHKHDHS